MAAHQRKHDAAKAAEMIAECIDLAPFVDAWATDCEGATIYVNVEGMPYHLTVEPAGPLASAS